MTKITFKIGKRTCKCQYDINEEECKNSKMSCDKKCSGKMVWLELEDGKYLMNIMVKKGKVSIAKCETKGKLVWKEDNNDKNVFCREYRNWW